MTELLTKSLFLSGLRCPKKMWLEINNFERRESTSLAQQKLINQGFEVQEYARQKFSDSYLIEGKSLEAIEKTQEYLLDSSIGCLFEAAFLFDDILVRCDILQKTSNGTWDLIEIKSSGSVKPEHIDDVAIQKYVLVNCSLPINKVQIMHINTKDCFFPNLDNLFVIEDISSHVNNQLSEGLESKINELKQIINNNAEPINFIGKHCNIPHACPFKSHCWKDVPQASIFTIPRLSTEKLNQLIEKQIFAIEDIDNRIKLTSKQQEYVNLIIREQPDIDYKEIGNALSELKYPLHFFDIETHNPAIPRFDGLKPYEQFIFQYSCHILQEDGILDHYEYLHTDTLDPRQSVIESLIHHIQPTGTIIVYHKSFEGSIIKKLAQDFPEYEEELLSIVERLWDLEEIFKKYYKHPEFYGSTSIKNVLPVLVQDLSYNDLEIQRGDAAQAIWDSMIICSNENQKLKMIKDLKDYCALDTLAMVRIYQKLLELCY